MNDLEHALKVDLAKRVDHLIGEPLNESTVAEFNKIVKDFVMETEIILQNMMHSGVYGIEVKIGANNGK